MEKFTTVYYCRLKYIYKRKSSVLFPLWSIYTRYILLRLLCIFYYIFMLLCVYILSFLYFIRFCFYVLRRVIKKNHYITHTGKNLKTFIRCPFQSKWHLSHCYTSKQLKIKGVAQRPNLVVQDFELMSSLAFKPFSYCCGLLWFSVLCC